MDPRAVLRGAGRAQVERARHLPELRVDVLPFAHAQVVEVFGLAHPPERAGRPGLLLLLEVLPELEVGEEVGVGVGEPGVQLVGVRPMLQRPLPRVLDGQCRGDHHHLGEAAGAAALQHHPGQPRVDRELGQPAADVGEALAGVERAQLLEQVDAVGDVAPVRRVDERERGDVAQADGGHLEDDAGQVGAQDLRFGVFRAGQEVRLVVQPDADAVGRAAAAALALVGRGLRDRLDGQPLHLEAVAVAGHPGGAGVDHVLDAGDGERGLGHVGGEHDPAAAVGLEDAVLLGRGEPGVQREDLQVPDVQPGQRLGGVADLPLAAQEHQDVARALGAQLLDGLADRRDRVADAGAGGVVLFVVGVTLALGLVQDQRAVAELDRVRPPGHLDDRRLSAVRPAEVLGEALGLDGRGGDDDLEVGPAGEQLLEVAEDEVDVEAALVGLVDDQRVVSQQVAVALELGEQDAVGHQLDEGVVADPVGEPDRVADRAAQLGAQLLGDAVGDGAGGDPARLGVPDQAAHPAPELQADLRDLGGLARAGLARHDHHLVVADRLGDVGPALADRQLGRVADLRDGGGAAAYPVRSGGDLRLDLGGRGGALRRVADLAGAVEPPTQAPLVADHEVGEEAARVHLADKDIHRRRRGPPVIASGRRVAPGEANANAK